MGVKGIVLPPGAYKNASNSWMYVYGTDSITITDESGNTVDIQNLPSWLPPNFTLTPTNSSNRLLALKADTPGSVMEFAGFLSKPQIAQALPPKSGGLLVSYGTKVTSAVAQEFEKLGTSSTSVNTLHETVALTHT